MSAKQDLIEYEKIISQCNDLINKQREGWQSVIDEIKKLNASVPSTFVNAQKTVAQSVTDLNNAEKEYQVTAKKSEAVRERIKKQLTEEERLERAIYREKERNLNQEAKWQAQLTKSENLYTKIQAKVSATTQAYNDLATRKQLGIDLNDREQRTLALLEARLNKYNTVLKTVDANIGNNRRNVGNYASGWNGLSNSINQITREMPAFAVSMNTGFLAISNNLPILFDEIQRVRNEVALLRAQGKPTESVLSRLATSFFSLQTALSLGVTLLTIYGKDIVEFIATMITASKAVDGAKASLEAYKEVLKSNEYTTAYEKIARVKVAFDLANQGAISGTEANKIYNEELGAVMGTTKTFQEAERIFISQARNYVEATIAKAQANLLLQKSAELSAENLEIQTRKEATWSERLKGVLQTGGIFGQLWNNLTGDSKDLAGDKVLSNRTKQIQENTEAIKANNKQAEELIAKALEQSKALNFDSKNTAGKKGSGKTAEQLEEERLKRLIELEKQAQKTLESENKLQIAQKETALEYEEAYILRQKSALDLYNSNLKIAELELGNSKKSKKEQENDALELKNRKEQLANELASSLIEIDNAEIKRKKDLTDKEYKANEQIISARKKLRKDQNDLLDLELKTQLVGLEDFRKIQEIKAKELENWYATNLELTKDDFSERLKVQAEYNLRSKELEEDKVKAFKQTMKGTAYNMLSSLGGDSLAQFFNGEFEQIWQGAETLGEKIGAVMRAIGEISAEVMGQISAMQNANFQAQLSRLETEKEVALQFAGESATGREAIEAQYDERKKAIQKKQAQNEKKMALLQIAINTAVGITSALSMGLPGIPLAVVIGALGAVQLALVASQPIPEFWQGTDNAPEGLALTQERGAEMITDKNNRIKSLGNNKGAQLTYLNKGDKVYTASETTQRINDILLGTGVSPIVNVDNNGLTKDEMIEVMNKTLAKQSVYKTTFDENGVSSFIENKSSRTKIKLKNARI